MHAHPFTLLDQNNETHTLELYENKWIILYFYPKDMTPGCTVEACSFRDNLERLISKGVVVLGVSADSVQSHQKFADKYHLGFPLLSDPDHKVADDYGAYGKKKFMGREYMGIFRKSFLIDPEGNIAKTYETVKPDNHVEEILEDLTKLQSK